MRESTLATSSFLSLHYEKVRRSSIEGIEVERRKKREKERKEGRGEGERGRNVETESLNDGKRVNTRVNKILVSDFNRL